MTKGNSAPDSRDGFKTMKSFFDDRYYLSAKREPNGLVKCCPSPFFFIILAYLVSRAIWDVKRGKYTEKCWAESSLAVLRLAEWVGIRFEIENLCNIKKTQGPFVLIANHMSTLETFVLPSLIQPLHKHTYVVKEALVRHPFFRDIIRSRDPIGVGRTNPKEDFREVLKKGRELLEARISVVIFPQRTRTQSFDPGTFNTLGIKLARHAGVPAVPLALQTDAWSTGRMIRDLGRIYPQRRVHFSFGKPLLIHGTGRTEHQEIVRFITSRLEAWKA